MTNALGLGLLALVIGQAPPAAPATPGDLRVMTYNIKHGQTNAACTQPAAAPGQPPAPDCNLDLQAAIAVIREHNPDVIGLQEIDRFWARSGYADQPAVLSAALGMEHRCYAANLDHPADVHADRPHQYGTLILSRLPIPSCSTTPLPRTGDNEPRGFTLAEIDVRGTPLHFYNTHLHTTAADRLLQTPAMAIALGAIHAPEAATRVVVGDFNARPDATELQPLMARLTDAWQMNASPSPDNPDGRTSPADLHGPPRNRIDYVLVSSAARIRAAAVPIDAKTRLAADHYPVLVDLTLPAAGPAPAARPRFVARWGGVTKDLGFGAAADATSVFVTGATWSADFPVSSGAPPSGDAWCAFLTQLHLANGALAQSSVLCGRGMTYGRAAAADGRGGVWIAGSSDAADLPASRNASQATFGGGSSAGAGDAFIARWSADGRLDHLTYLGGAGDETAWGMTSDNHGGVWAVGSTTSRPLVSRDSSPTGTIASADGFLAHVTANGRLAAVKIIGGDGVDELYDVALIDPQRLVVVGASASTDGALGMARGSLDGVVAMLDPATLKVAWTVRLGGVGNDALRGVTVVDGRTIVAVGQTDGGACSPRHGGSDGWLVSLSLTGEVLRSTCVGTGASDDLSDVVADDAGGIWITGTTNAASPHRAVTGMAHHRAFVATARPIGAVGPLRLLSNEIARGYAITADAGGRVYAIGETTAVPSNTGPWIPALHPTAGAFRGSRPPGSTDPYVVALRR